MPSATVEDYVKAIYLAREARSTGKGRARPGAVALGDLAARMGVVPGTATSMVKALSEAGLVDYEPRRGARLTPHGEKLALHVLRRHRLIELFLVRALKLDWSEVHDEAEALEHAVSDKVLDALDAFLGRPREDPHGDPIPTHAGQLREQRSRPLTACAPGDSVRILRVANDDPAFLRYAEKHGLTPGTALLLRQCDPASDTLVVSLARSRQVTLGHTAAARIRVTE